MSEGQPDRKVFESLEKKYQEENQELVDKAHVDALIEDILRNADTQDLKNLRYFEYVEGMKQYVGEISGHHIDLRWGPGARDGYTVKIDNLSETKATESGYLGSRFDELWYKINESQGR